MLQKTLVVFKPDSVNVENAIVKKILNLGNISLIKQRWIFTSEDLITKNYVHGERKYAYYGKNHLNNHPYINYTDENILKYGKMVIKNICKYMGNKLLYVCIFKGENVIEKLRFKVGTADPSKALIGTIRNIYSKDSFKQADEEDRAIRNVIHTSDSPKTAEYEISLWFSLGLGVVYDDKNIMKNIFNQYQKGSLIWALLYLQFNKKIWYN